MEVGQWRITTWTGPNRDSVYVWIRGVERERGEERRIWMLIFAYSYCKNYRKYFIYPGYMTYYQIWFQYDSIRVFLFNVSIILSEWFYSYPQNQYA